MKGGASILTILLLMIVTLAAHAESLLVQESTPKPTTTLVSELQLTDARVRSDGSIEFQVNSTQQFKSL